MTITVKRKRVPVVAVSAVVPTDVPESSIHQRRRSGERANLTEARILEAARKVLATQPGPVNVRAVAAELGVAHNSVSEKLRRNGTTLEKELARHFLTRISKPMVPGDLWSDNIRDLFVDALHECETHPGLARAVTPHLSQSPHISKQFTERVLHVLASAGLSLDDTVASYEVLLVCLCGMLTVRFPDFGSDPTVWAETVAADMDVVYERELPMMYRLRERLTETYTEKSRPMFRPKNTSASSPEVVSSLVVMRIRQLAAGK